MTTLTGNCVECGFPIALKEIGHPVSCPFCSTKNLPLEATVNHRVSSGFSISPTGLLVGVAILVGVIVVAKGRR
jgi:hypothetical protein